jgi:TatD DNase family protein
VSSGSNASPEATPGRPALVDTHAHLNLKAYRKDRPETIRRAADAGVRFIINVGFDLKTSVESVELANSDPSIRASVGVHPHDASSLDDDLLAKLRTLAGSPAVVAVGETGLDYYRDLSPRDDQRRAFRKQIGLARDLGLPLIVHNRDALEDTMAIVEEEGVADIGGVMHCFPGDERYAERVVRAGFHIGVGGPVTYGSSGRLARVAATVPLDRLLLETDSPWLPPSPHRGGRNEPAFVSLVAERVAELRDMSVSDLARATTGNSTRLFGFPKAGEPAIAYEMHGNLYLNITNRCTNRCCFCIRNQTDTLWGYNLRLREEPTVEQILAAVGDPSRYREIVFCGYGEPTLRLDVIEAVGRRLRAAGARVRIDTNGQGNLIWNRNIAPEIAEAADAVSVSLNAESAETYDRICGSRFGPDAYKHVIAFIRACVAAGLEVTASVVDVPEIDLGGARRVADELGVPLRVRGGYRSAPGAGR